MAKVIENDKQRENICKAQLILLTLGNYDWKIEFALKLLYEAVLEYDVNCDEEK
jgi:hypothetical protein